MITITQLHVNHRELKEINFARIIAYSEPSCSTISRKHKLLV